MPSRMPIIPTCLGNRMLLRALHNEMLEKQFLNETKLTSESTSSGVHSNNLSEESDPDKCSETLSKRQSILAMPEDTFDAATTQNGWTGDFVDSDSGSGDDDSLDRSYETGQSQSVSSSDENINLAGRKTAPIPVHKNNLNSRLYRATKPLPVQHRAANIVVAPLKMKELSEKEKKQIRQGYERHVVNGERPATGALFGPRTSRFCHPNETENNQSDDEIVFPLEKAAAGRAEKLGVKQAKAIENAAKRKTKFEKQAIAEAKLTVAEAKLTEFEAKLRARQARIDERHAKLCHRRAVIKDAEDRLQDLESRLDDEEEYHRERERRVKNRERRVKQEEAGIQIKEVSLKKRETRITEDLKSIERRRKIVEEKEAMSQTMQDIMTKRENLYREQHEKKNKRNFGTLTKLLRRQAAKETPETSDTEATRNRQFSSTSSVSQQGSSSTGSPLPVPTPRKSLRSHEILDKKDRKNRSNSFGSMLEIEDFPTTPNKNERTNKIPLESPSRNQKSAIMGLWL